MGKGREQREREGAVVVAWSGRWSAELNLTLPPLLRQARLPRRQHDLGSDREMINPFSSSYRPPASEPPSNAFIYSWSTEPLDVLAQPPKPLPIPLPHNHRAHENLNRPNILQGHLTLPRSLIKPQSLTKLFLAHCPRGIDLVAQDEERNLA